MRNLFLFACLGLVLWLGINCLPLPSPPPEPSLSSIEQNTFHLINGERASKNLNELQWDKNLHGSAREHSEWMAITDNLTHSSYDFLENCWRGVNYKPEELAKACFISWRDSPLHYENLLEPSIKYCAIGFAQSENGTYATFIAK